MSQSSIFYERLKKELVGLEKSVNQVERELGYSRNTLQNYKYGGKPSGERLIEVAQYLDVTPEYLLGKEINSVSILVKLLFNELNQKQKSEMVSLCQTWKKSPQNLN